MSTLKVNTIQDTSGGATTLVSAQNTAKAWALWNTYTSHSLTNSFNVSSITDGGTGRTTINFTTNMPNANYIVAGSASGPTGPGARVFHSPQYDTNTSNAVDKCYVGTSVTNTQFIDADFVHVVIFGD